MINVENLVFDTVFNAVRTVYPSIEINKGFIEETAVFPCIIIREVNNIPVEETNTDDCAENYTRLTYQVDVYSNKAGSARSECKDLLELVDTTMQSMKFRRTHTSEPFNINRTLFRQYTRYTVIVANGVDTVTGEGNEQTTTTTFQLYRRVGA